MQREYGWPTFIDATTGKNRPDRIIKSVEQVSGRSCFTKRCNRSTKRCCERSSGRRSSSKPTRLWKSTCVAAAFARTLDLILGLPGESKEPSGGLVTLLDSNIDQMHNFQAMLLKGAEMETLACREMFHFTTGFPRIAKNFGVIEDRKVFDVEEDHCGYGHPPVRRLPCLPQMAPRKQRVLERRLVRGGSAVYALARHSQLRMVVTNATGAGEMATPSVRGFLDSFIAETKGELFPDPSRASPSTLKKRISKSSNVEKVGATT